MTTAAQLLIQCLEEQGTDRIFCVPGESYLAILDALFDSSIQVVVAKHEGGAAMMAEADGKLTRRPGICFVTRGPGATNAAAGVHVAQQDSTPMILFIGQIGRGLTGRDAFQEVDFNQMYGGLAKLTLQIDDPGRIPELLSRAFHVALNGRPGPVIIALPEDMLRQSVKTASAHATPRIEATEPAPSVSQIKQAELLIMNSERPVLILGGSRWDATAVAKTQEWVTSVGLPAAVSFRRQQLFDATHPNYAGDLGIGANPALVRLIKDSDLVILLGARLSEIASQNFSLLDIPVPQQNLIHVHPGTEELGRIYTPTLAINATPLSFVESLGKIECRPGTVDRVTEAHSAYEKWNNDIPTIPGPVQLGEVVRVLQEKLSAQDIITNGAGNYSAWIHRFYRYRAYGTQVAPTSGSMGYGLPAAIAAKLRCPERTVVCLAGDGCFQMTSQELGTAAQSGAHVIILVIDNGIYGTIRMHQEREYPRRISGTDIENPDFAALARSYGLFAGTVEKTEDFEPLLNEALACHTSALLHIKIDPEAISPSTTIAKLRGQKR
ncbi:MAG TPA: thiamine pyrophosphate-binding protein [Gammaproteobacteria bacterium]|nr:thiamine pyrophosphate-binding protein [Gammaproteobacteria bacterium]HIL98094.1 thiamine pyrophosphate-binding protein [Pseudomonadales bacterium]